MCPFVNSPDNIDKHVGIHQLDQSINNIIDNQSIYYIRYNEVGLYFYSKIITCNTYEDIITSQSRVLDALIC